MFLILTLGEDGGVYIRLDTLYIKYRHIKIRKKPINKHLVKINTSIDKFLPFFKVDFFLVNPII